MSKNNVGMLAGDPTKVTSHVKTTPMANRLNCSNRSLAVYQPFKNGRRPFRQLSYYLFKKDIKAIQMPAASLSKNSLLIQMARLICSEKYSAAASC